VAENFSCKCSAFFESWHEAMALVLPIWILSGLTFSEALAVFLFIMSADVLVLFGMSVVNVIFPTFDSRNVLTVYLRFAVFALSMAPAILIALFIGIPTQAFSGLLWFCRRCRSNRFLTATYYRQNLLAHGDAKLVILDVAASI